MPIATDDIEEHICDICNEHAPLFRIPFTDRRGLFDQDHVFFVCEKCRLQLLIYDVVIHNGSGYGTRFSEIREVHKFLDYKEIAETVENSSWGRVENTSNGNKVLMKNDWKALQKAVER